MAQKWPICAQNCPKKLNTYIHTIPEWACFIEKYFITLGGDLRLENPLNASTSSNVMCVLSSLLGGAHCCLLRGMIEGRVSYTIDSFFLSARISFESRTRSHPFHSFPKSYDRRNDLEWIGSRIRALFFIHISGGIYTIGWIYTIAWGNGSVA